MIRLPQSLIPTTTTDPCSFEATDISKCKDGASFKKQLADDLAGIWGPIVTIFRVIAVLYFVKQLFAIYKNIVGQKHVDAAKSFAYLVLGTFLMFDIGNTVWIAFSFKNLVQTLIDKIGDTLGREKQKPAGT